MPNKLEDIEPDEISLVDVPATKRTFLFKKADVAEEDRIIPNGIITCPSCGHEEALVDFVKSASEECPECEENLLSSDTEITFKKRRLRMKKKLSEILKSFLEDEEEELTDEDLELIEKAEKALDPDAAKALKGAIVLLGKYKGQYPDDVKSAINTLAKFATFGAAKKAADDDDDDEDLKKAGAKLSKDTVKKLMKIFSLMEKAPEALKLLKEMLPDSAKKSDVENKIDELMEKIDKMKKADDDDDDDDDDKKKKLKKKKKDDDDDDDDDDKSELMKQLESLTKTVNKIAKQKGLKKSKDGNEDDDDDDDDDVKKKGSKKWSFSFAAPKESDED